jgi:hypothetical protein
MKKSSHGVEKSKIRIYTNDTGVDPGCQKYGSGILVFQSVFPIRDILVRIRILGYVPKSSVTFKMQKNPFFHIFYVFFNE